MDEKRVAVEMLPLQCCGQRSDVDLLLGQDMKQKCVAHGSLPVFQSYPSKLRTWLTTTPMKVTAMLAVLCAVYVIARGTCTCQNKTTIGQEQFERTGETPISNHSENRKESNISDPVSKEKTKFRQEESKNGAMLNERENEEKTMFGEPVTEEKPKLSELESEDKPNFNQSENKEDAKFNKTEDRDKPTFSEPVTEERPLSELESKKKPSFSHPEIAEVLKHGTCTCQNKTTIGQEQFERTGETPISNHSENRKESNISDPVSKEKTKFRQEESKNGAMLNERENEEKTMFDEPVTEEKPKLSELESEDKPNFNQSENKEDAKFNKTEDRDKPTFSEPVTEERPLSELESKKKPSFSHPEIAEVLKHGRRITGTLTVKNGGTRGSWFPPQFCPVETFAVGFNMKYQEYQGPGGDDTALNAISLQCADRNGNRRKGHSLIQSAAGHRGQWTGDVFCSRNSSVPLFLQSFSLNVPNKTEDGDDISTKSIRFSCNGFRGEQTPQQLNGNVNAAADQYGSWSDSCPVGSAICGLQTRIEGHRAEIDNTALNDVSFFCCDGDFTD